MIGSWMTTSRAQVVEPNFWVTDGSVYGVAQIGSTIYLGGDFTTVGPATGGGVPLSIATGEPIKPYPKVLGAVSVEVSDGSGGWFIGGSFVAVGGQPRSNLAHILADGSVGPWNPASSSTRPVEYGEIYSMAVAGGVVYVGGKFTAVGGQARNHLAAIDAVTGAATDWNPNPDGEVDALLVAGGTVYAGGTFYHVGGATRYYLAAFDLASGDTTSWNLEINAYSRVQALALSGNTLYVGGDIISLGGQLRYGAGAVDATTAQVTPWNLDLQGGYSSPLVVSIVPRGGLVYVAGNFDIVGGQARKGLAAVDATSGAPSAWNPQLERSEASQIPDLWVFGLDVVGNTVYAAGVFGHVGGQVRHNIAAIDATTGAPTAWNPYATEFIRSMAISGGTVYVGGPFSSIGGVSRNNLAALDATTGAATAWSPDAIGGVVLALTANGNAVYAGGNFDHIGGQQRKGLVALDAVTGTPTSWDPGGGYVSSLAVSGNTVYAGGSFSDIGGQPRNCLAALDAATGAATGWNPALTGVNPYVSALAVSGGTVYVGGVFNGFAGQPRHCLAALDATSGSATAWDPDPTDISAVLVNTIMVSGGTVYAGGRFTTIGGQPRRNLAALDAATGAATAWNPSPDDLYGNAEILALAVDGGSVYAGGSFSSIGGQARFNLAALSVSTGLATDWAPTPNSTTRALSVGNGHVFAGGDFTSIGGEPQAGIAAVRADTTTATLLALFEAIPTADGIELRWRFGDGIGVTTVAVERASQATGPWERIAPELRDESGVTVALDRTAGDDAESFYRLVAQFRDGSTSIFGPVLASYRALPSRSDLTLLAPNPSSGVTQVQYDVARAGHVRLELLDVSGRVAATLVDRAQEPGRYVAGWDGRGRSGRPSPGLYFVRLMAPDRVTVRKLAIVR